MSAQVMDTMEIEKERGITIKAQSVRLNYHYKGENYILNLIDTPGHVDFSYEVSRSLASCEGALLVVDASQGVEAQTIANVYIALENNLEIIPVLNKIDLPAANVERVTQEIEQTIGLDCTHALQVSAKANIGIKELLDSIVEKIPAPTGDCDAPTKALIYDSWFDNYLGALALVRVFDGSIKVGQNLYIMGSGKSHEVLDLMYPHPLRQEKTKAIQCLDGVLVPPASVEELKTLATKAELVKEYGKDILKALEPLNEQEGKKEVKEQKQKVKEADKKQKEDKEEDNDDELFS